MVGASQKQQCTMYKIIITKTMIPKFLAAIVLSISVTSSAAMFNRVDIASFSAGSLNGWESKSFVGKTNYKIKQDGELSVLAAESIGTASGLGRKITIDLTRTPYVNWSWKVEQSLPRLEETQKGGDDYAARLYVIKSGGLIIWNTKALNYVWSSSQQKETVWPNAFKPKNAIMFAVRGPEDSTGGWRHEKRNVREDFKQIFGKDVKSIDGIAIMTDTDNSGLHASAVYGDIYFSAE